ncbi:IPT/TIG domain-containing protein [Actinoplanes sp. NPDC023801]|uniref:beta strand repeat-containing protein n=1 Tax=Actinoplanes sp. NPDC023801 TaxID=3154595 RepID=UPI0033F0ECFD
MRNSLQRRRTRLVGAGLVTGAVVTAMAGTQLPALAAPLTSLTGGGPVGSTVVAKGLTSNANATVGAIFTTATSCPSTYNTTAPNVAATNPTKLSATSASFTVPSGLTLNTGSLPKPYFVCVYNGTTVGTSAVLNDATQFVLTPTATVTPTSGVSGGGNTITINAPTGVTSLFTTATPFVAFASSATGCGQVANDTDPANIAATSTKVSAAQITATVPAGVGGPNGTGFNVCVYTESGGSGTPVAVGTYSVTLGAVTQSSTVGPELATVTLTGATAFLTGIEPVAEVVAPATTTTATPCPALYTTVDPGVIEAADVRKISNAKVAVTMPAVVDVGDGPYSICLYSSTSTTTGRLLAAGTYTAAAVPTLTIVSPSSGTPLGGVTMTVKGTNLPTTPGSITATLGGSPLTVTPVNETTFTAVTPPNSLGSKALNITTASGTATLSGAFTYVNSLAVIPNTAPNTTIAQDINVLGTGFLEYNFNDAANTDAHVYLVHGRWNGAAHVTTGNRANVNAVADCTDVLVVSDTELVCSLDLAHALTAAGTETTNANGARTVVEAITLVDDQYQLVSANANFTKADIGKAISMAGTGDYPVGTVITDVLDERTAVLSQEPSVTGATTGFDIGSTRNVTGSNAAQDGTSLSASPGSFSAADVGAYIAHANLAADTFITGVNESGSTVTLSRPVTTAIVAGSVEVASSNAVPAGAYNVTVVSDADPANASTASVTSSGSTFTVAPF